MEKTVVNFSRHPFNADQKRLLAAVGLEFSDEVKAPYFQDAKSLMRQTQGKICSLVAPMGLLLEVLAENSYAARFTDHPVGDWDCRIIDWQADEAARRRGRFAVRTMRVFKIDAFVDLFLTVDCTPTVENDYRTGEEFPYEGEVAQ